jgi:dienelactone hydrolase
VGVRSLLLTDKARVDVERFDAAKGVAPVGDRALEVTVWYPAAGRTGALEGYAGKLPSLTPDGSPIAYTIPGLARRDAPAARGPFPLVVLSHGFGGHPGVVSWLGENLASKGYVVAAPAHRDPPFTQALALAPALLHRPLDQALVASELQKRARSGPAPWRGLIDPARVALVGYSMGGYGALRAAGAPFNPDGAPAAYVPGKLLGPHVRGGAQAGKGPLVEGLKAAVLIAPWGGQSTFRAFAPEDLKQVSAPLLFLVGDRDDISGYEDGVRTLFDGAVSRPGACWCSRTAATPSARARRRRPRASAWSTEAYFEDPRLAQGSRAGISLHFITAFLDLHVKGDTAKAAYLDVATERSAEARGRLFRVRTRRRLAPDSRA